MTGRVVDTSGNPVPRALVMLFRTDGARADEPYIVHATASGVFRFGPARGGTYVVLAVSAQSSPPQRGDTEHLARLLAAGERVTLDDLGERKVDLRLFADR